MIAFIVQARLGSTRLPNKILLPFYKEKSIISLLIDKLFLFKDVKTIIATSSDSVNDPLVQFLQKKNVLYFRGDENDVLDRFISTAEFYGIDRIIRICSDNPFLEINSLEQIVMRSRNSDADYISFQVNGQPSIKTHFGFWTESVTLDALKKVQEKTSELLYHEHVTNYIYTNPDKFKIEWIPGPECLKNREDIRLTTDTLVDFENAREIYGEFCRKRMPYPSIKDIVTYLDMHSDRLRLMKSEILKNSK